MTIFEAGLLGIIQGLTEFLPVSSSGHIELGKAILKDPEALEQTNNLLFTILVHFATALATLVVFRKEVAFIIKHLFQFRWNEETRFSLKILLSMIPAAVIGFAFESDMELLFSGQVVLVGLMLYITGFLLLLADRAKKTTRSISFLDAIIIGVAQAIAILPGISRSGATIATSVLLGNDKSKAARFSFLMVVPLIFGKIAKDVMSGELSQTIGMNTAYAVGFLTAFVSGLFACMFMIKLVKSSKLWYFSVYCFVVGSIAIILNY
ncbi:MAG: undecaprenyl-diphosphate phosphatase [Flavobacteriaceae bacterium]|nr:undecaprenyl-diphosphate phosphatase [Flavobacteriaceae bacterium]